MKHLLLYAFSTAIFSTLLRPACAQDPTADAPVKAATRWTPVPPMDWTGIKAADFADHELEIPYLLNHFHRIANAVVETGENRGFIDIKVWRNIEDNEPYNARIMENMLAFSYLYAVKRPWNPYYNSPAIKERLEAMLEFWCKIQGPDGRFTEYSATNWSLAPTGFGVRAMAQTLELLNKNGPTVDAAILQKAMAAQRKAIMAILTLRISFEDGREYSNQFSSVYEAALSYLMLREDAEMKMKFEAVVKRAMTEHQSPAGFMYEKKGADSRYSDVHDNNLRLSWRYIKQNPIIREELLKESENWHEWMSYNFVSQPGTDGYWTNAGINTRTSDAFRTGIIGKFRPIAENVEMARAFSFTAEEQKRNVAAERAELEANWPNFPALVVPSTRSYHTGGFQNAYGNPNNWFPTAKQKEAAVAKLPYLAQSSFVRQANDAFPYRFTFVRNPSYYAIFNAGKMNPKNTHKQVYGLGLLWNPTIGAVMQSVANTRWMWGTKLPDTPQVRETSDVTASIALDGQSLTAEPGAKNYAAAPVQASYDLPGGGQKTIQLNPASIDVEVSHAGEWSEQLPLIKRKGATLQKTPGKITLLYQGTSFVIAFPENVVVEMQPGEPAPPDVERVLVKLKAKDSLTYNLAFQSGTR